MFWNKKEPCFHEWKVSDFYISYSFMADADNIYKIICTKCKKERTLNEYDYGQMEAKGFIKSRF